MSKPETIEKCYCEKCGHDWWPTRPGRPAVCPTCKNPRWDVGPKQKGMGRPKK